MPNDSNLYPDGSSSIFWTAVINFTSFMRSTSSPTRSSPTRSSPTSRLNECFDLVLNSNKFGDGEIDIVEELLGLLENTPCQHYADDVVGRLQSVDKKLVKYATYNISVVDDGKNERVISVLLGRIRAITEPRSCAQSESSIYQPFI